ncbi:MAG TPA: response regulator [Nitrospira sp.]
MVKLLVIDDDRMNCDLLQAVLTRHGYEVHTTTSGIEGLNLFRKHAPRVTILDLRMPGMDGLTVLKEIRAMDPHAPVIILGGGATEIQENQARALRVTDFVRKGLSLDVLVEGVNRVVQHPLKESGEDRTAAAVTGPARDTGETVLVVDDEQLVRDLLVQFLSLRGYRALGVKDGSGALAMVEQAPPDLILLDVFLPGMNGVEVLRRLRQKEFGGAVIIITGSHDEEVLEEAWALHPQEVLTKPIDLERMLSIIQLVLVCREC